MLGFGAHKTSSKEMQLPRWQVGLRDFGPTVDSMGPYRAAASIHQM